MSSPDLYKDLSFKRLSETVYVHQPTPAAVKAETKDPETILLCAWMGAPPRPLRKYTDEYISIYPHSTIVLCVSSYSHFLATPESTLKKDLEAAIPYLTTNPSNDKLLIHVFSNGGAYNLHLLTHLYLLNTTRPLPYSKLIFDSCPSTIGEITSNANAFSYSLPKTPIIYYPGYALCWLMVLTIAIYSEVSHNKVSILRAYEGLNDEKLLEVTGKQRCYIYSEKDGLVNFRHVEDHAWMAKVEGAKVRMEKFEGTGHVAHMVGDRERYWRIVKGVWAA
ncbi:hypothetical protein HK097_005443 [Rhizophlyctis rosea]|uniref:Indole-diterpene biosynthesis protein PaxU n=1 Tax=Rhizophlyctis rosea TaxID=64517 RepID=A0AAD5SDB7_9FUNG|nr:hypothetical protein HK097_005443 [Rhizophlyctis rosea]